MKEKKNIKEILDISKETIKLLLDQFSLYVGPDDEIANIVKEIAYKAIDTIEKFQE